MLNLKKPLEGVPGLLLLAALVLFGATIGISLALVFSLVEMKDSLANFLGGVVGAGLGAALAVLGAVYVQQRERRDQLSGTINQLIARLSILRAFAVLFSMEIKNAPATGIAGSHAEAHLQTRAGTLLEQFATLVPPYELSREAIARVDGLRLGGLEAWSMPTTSKGRSPTDHQSKNGQRSSHRV